MIVESNQSEPTKKRRFGLSSPSEAYSIQATEIKKVDILTNINENIIPSNEGIFSSFLKSIFPCLFVLNEKQEKNESKPIDSLIIENSREEIRKKWKEAQEKYLEVLKNEAIINSDSVSKAKSSKIRRNAAILIQTHIRIYLAKLIANKLRKELFNLSNTFWVQKYNEAYMIKEKDRITRFVIKETALDFVSQLFTAGKEITALSNQASIILQKNWRGYKVRKNLSHQSTYCPHRKIRRKKIPRIDSHPSSLPSRLSLISLRRLWAKKWYEPQNSVYLHHVGPSPLDIFNNGKKLKKKYDKIGKLYFPRKKNPKFTQNQLKEEIFGPQSIMFKYQTLPPEGKKHGLRSKKIIFPSSLKNQYSMFSIQNDPMSWVAFPIGIETKEELKKKIDINVSPAVKAFLKYSPYSQKFVYNLVKEKKGQKFIKNNNSLDSQLDDLVKLGYDKTNEELIRDSSQPAIGSIQYDSQTGYRIEYKGNNQWEKISTGERIQIKDNYEAEGLALSSHYSLLNNYLMESGIAQANGISDLNTKVLTAEPVIKFLPGGQISITAAPLTLNSFSLTGPLALIASQSGSTLNDHIKSFSQSLSLIKSGKMNNILKKQKKVSSTSIARLDAINSYKQNLGRKPSGWTNLKILSQMNVTEDIKDKYIGKLEKNKSNKLFLNNLSSIKAEKESHSKNPNITLILDNNRRVLQNSVTQNLSKKAIESKLFPNKKKSKFFSYNYTWLPQPVIHNSVNSLLYKRPYKQFRDETKVLVDQENLHEKINKLQEYDEELYLENVAPSTVPLFPIQESEIENENDLVIYDENDDGDNFSLFEKDFNNELEEKEKKNLSIKDLQSPINNSKTLPSISYVDGNIVFNNSMSSSTFSKENSFLDLQSKPFHSSETKNVSQIVLSQPSSTIVSYSEWDNYVTPPNKNNFLDSGSSTSYYSKIPDIQSSTTFLSLLEKKQTNNIENSLKNTSTILKNSQNISEILEKEAKINRKQLENRSKLRAKSRVIVSMSPSSYKDEIIQEQLEYEKKKKIENSQKILNKSQSYALTHNPSLKSNSPEIDSFDSNIVSSTTNYSHYHSHNPAKPSWSFHDFLATTKPGELANIPRVAQSGFSQSHRDGKPVHLKARFKPFYNSNKGSKIDPLHPYSWH